MTGICHDGCRECNNRCEKTTNHRVHKCSVHARRTEVPYVPITQTKTITLDANEWEWVLKSLREQLMHEYKFSTDSVAARRTRTALEAIERA